jgi:hypothetical protein
MLGSVMIWPGINALCLLDYRILFVFGTAAGGGQKTVLICVDPAMDTSSSDCQHRVRISFYSYYRTGTDYLARLKERINQSNESKMYDIVHIMACAPICNKK